MPARINTAERVGGRDASTLNNSLSDNLKKDRIKVVVRLRPATTKTNKKSITVLDDTSVFLVEKGNISETINSDLKRKKVHDGYQFTFDAVFGEDATQEEVYNVTAKCLVNEMIAGYNGMIFAYGATGSGKTYTMMAMNHIAEDSINYSNCGIMIQTFKDLFSIIEEHQENYIVTLSYMEIYNETIRDLFSTDSNYLELRGNSDIQIVGLTEIVVTSPHQAINLLRKGNDIRSVRYTGANSASSRSHAILIIILRQTAENSDHNFKPSARQSKLLFVDLAGSERAKHTKNRGKRLYEGGQINKSLLALGNCISALSSGTKAFHVNFRDSKLTRLLREPLSGNYRTIMIAQVNPTSEYKEDIKNTLIFASKAMGITKRLKPNTVYSVNQVSWYQNLIGELNDEVVRLKSKIKEQGHGSRDMVKNYNKAKKLRDEMISVFEERMKLRQQLLDVDDRLLFLNSESEKQHQSISHWQSKSSKLYYWRYSPNYDGKDETNNSLARQHINEALSSLSSIEKEQDELLKSRNELVEKLEHMKERAILLENELANLDEDTEKELLKLFCRVHELEADKLSLQGERMLGAFELRRFNELIVQHQEQQKISDHIITKQRQLIEENKIQIPVDLQTLYLLYQEKIHIMTLKTFKNYSSYIEGKQFGLPALEETEKDVTSNLRSQFETLRTSFDSKEGWVEQDEKSITRLPRITSSAGNGSPTYLRNCNMQESGVLEKSYMSRQIAEFHKYIDAKTAYEYIASIAQPRYRATYVALFRTPVPDPFQHLPNYIN